jgi:hypothetical protein
MTFQTSEQFLYRGQKLLSRNCPLALHPHAPEFLTVTSMCRRGYNGTWSIQNHQLFLIKLEAYIQHPTAVFGKRVFDLDNESDDLCTKIINVPMAVKANLTEVFPETVDGKLFADWFSGDIHFGQGEGENQGLGDSYQRYLTLSFEKGILVNEVIKTYAEVFPPQSMEQRMEALLKAPSVRIGLSRIYKTK